MLFRSAARYRDLAAARSGHRWTAAEYVTRAIASDPPRHAGPVWQDRDLKISRGTARVEEIEAWAAEASGIAKPRLLMLIFLLAGALGGVAGGLFASLQSYITPDAFTFEMSVLFFIAIRYMRDLGFKAREASFSQLPREMKRIASDSVKLGWSETRLRFIILASAALGSAPKGDNRLAGACDLLQVKRNVSSLM